MIALIFGAGLGLMIFASWKAALALNSLNDEIKVQEQLIKKLKTSNSKLARDKKMLALQRDKTKAEYRDLSDQYFQLRYAPVSRGQERNPVIGYRAQLETYLRQRGSPLASYVDTLVLGETVTGVSAKLVIGISMVESVGGIRNANTYNAWGRKAKGSGYMAFPSWPDAILNQFHYIKERWNSSNPYALKGYATDPGWAKKVYTFMNQI